MNTSLVLRLSVASTFIAHGYIAITNPPPKWTAYLSNVGITRYQRNILPMIGCMDIGIGVCALLNYDVLALWALATTWAMATAFSRVVNGEGIAEFFERAGNFVPALLLASSHQDFEFWILCGVLALFIISLITQYLRIL